MRKVYEDFIYLMRCTLNGESAKDFSDGDFGGLFRIAQDHNMTNMLYYALRDNSNVPDEISRELQKYHDLMVYKCAHQKAAEQEIERLFNENEIRYMLLKGCTVRELYPSEDMREMVDIDVLVDETSLPKVKDIMSSEGYSFEGYLGFHHDVYIKESIITIEVHDETNDALSEYFSDPWNMAENDNLKYTFDLNDNYIFLMSHLIEHFKTSGIGVRAIADIYLYEKKHFEQLDWEYINSVFKRYEFLEITCNIRDLSEYWFGRLPDERIQMNLFDEMGTYVCESGSHGTLKNMVLHLSKEGESRAETVLKSVKKKLFVPPEKIKKRYRLIQKFPILLPCGYVVYILDKVFQQRERIKGWIKGVKNADENAIKEYKNMLKRFGIH